MSAQVSDGLAVLLRGMRGSTSATARAVATRHGRELLVAGAVPVEWNLDEFQAQVRTIERFKTGGEVIAVRSIGKGDAQEFSSVPMPASELDALRNCRAGSCSWRMPAAWIERLRREVDWDRPGSRDGSWRIVREEISDLISAYRRLGLTSLPQYCDKSRTLHASREMRELLEASAGILPAEMIQHMVAYPHSKLAGAEERLYWSLDRIGHRPVFSITHMTIYRASQGSLYIAARQIYGNHYLDGSIGVTRLQPNASNPRLSHLEYINRSRLDLLEGAFSGLRRAILEDAVRKTMQRCLGEIARRTRK